MKHYSYRERRAEHGQTILLVAVSMVALLAMAALARDVVSLYSARSEAQRAAEAAALAGAQVFANSGFTSGNATGSNQAYLIDPANNYAIANPTGGGGATAIVGQELHLAELQPGPANTPKALGLSQPRSRCHLGSKSICNLYRVKFVSTVATIILILPFAAKTTSAAVIQW